MAMAAHLGKTLKVNGVKNTGTEGAQEGGWILIDAGDIIGHLFRPEVRDFYQLEKMWLEPNTNSTNSSTGVASGQSADQTAGI